MPEREEKVIGWGAIILITAATALVVGFLLGLAGEVLGPSRYTTGAGVGAAAGVVGALLIGRRRAALERPRKP